MPIVSDGQYDNRESAALFDGGINNGLDAFLPLKCASWRALRAEPNAIAPIHSADAGTRAFLTVP
jgi:hypothetical protein